MNSISLKFTTSLKLRWIGQITKNILCIIGLFMQFSVMQATWIIVKIDNQSDLTFVKAARTDNNVEIQSISR